MIYKNTLLNNFSPVDDKVLKAKDVQQTDGSSDDGTLAGRRSEYGSINLIHYPDKQPPVDPLDDRIHELC